MLNFVVGQTFADLAQDGYDVSFEPQYTATHLRRKNSLVQKSQQLKHYAAGLPLF
jgi:hypothetical protein